MRPRLVLAGALVVAASLAAGSVRAAPAPAPVPALRGVAVGLYGDRDAGPAID
jgi:hypothetical protein